MPSFNPRHPSMGRRWSEGCGLGIPYVAVDGNDVAATAAAMEDVVLAARAGRGPAVVEAATYRWHGHYEGDPQRYRTPEEVQAWEGATRSWCMDLAFGKWESGT